MQAMAIVLLASFGATYSSRCLAQQIDKKTVIKPATKAGAADSGKGTPRKKASSTPTIKKETAGKPAKKKQQAKVKKLQKAASDSPTYIALKTNLLFDAVGIQNLSLEVQVHKHITVDFPVMWSIGDIEREHGLKTIAFQPERRWWLKSPGEGGHFFGIHAHAAWFNLKWEDTRYQTGKRPLLGAGVGYGYRLPMGSHWAAEFNVGFGYANMKYDTYYNIENGARLGNETKDYWGITRAGISLAYRF